MKLFNICKWLMIVSLSASTAFAAKLPVAENDLPISVNADNMVYDLSRNTVRVSGNVIVTRGEFRMTAAQIVLILVSDKADSPKKSGKSKQALTGISSAGKNSLVKEQNMENSKIDHIEAYGDVKFTYGKQSGQSSSATFDAINGVLTLRGTPIVRDENNHIQGETIRYHLNERRSEVVGTKKKRVEAVFGQKQ